MSGLVVRFSYPEEFLDELHRRFPGSVPADPPLVRLTREYRPCKGISLLLNVHVVATFVTLRPCPEITLLDHHCGQLTWPIDKNEPAERRARQVIDELTAKLTTDGYSTGAGVYEFWEKRA